MEDFETDCLQDRNCNFLQEYLGHSASGQCIATEHLAEFSRWTSLGSPQQINYAGQYILRYRVLDIFMDTMAAYRHPDLNTAPRSKLPVLTKRMNGVHKSLSDWTQCITKFLSFLDIRDGTPEISCTWGLNLLPWKSPQSKGDISISSAVDPPSPGRLHLPDQNEMPAFEHSRVDYSTPPSSSSEIDSTPLALLTKGTPSLSLSDFSALTPYAGSNLVRCNQSSWRSYSSSSPSIVLNAGVSCLLSCERHRAKASMHKVLFNLELAAFALSWMAMVCFDRNHIGSHGLNTAMFKGQISFPDTSDALVDSLHR